MPAALKEWRIYALPDGIFPQGLFFYVFCGVALNIAYNGAITGTGSLSNKLSITLPPNAPSSTRMVGTGSIMLNPVNGNPNYGTIEYACVEGTSGTPSSSSWQADTYFSGLQAGAAYTFYARYAGNNFYNPSNSISSGYTVYTKPEAPEVTEVTIDYEDETVAFDDSKLELSPSVIFSEMLKSGDSISDYTGRTLYLRVKAAGGVPVSESAVVVIPRRPTAALSVNYMDETLNTTADMQYRVGNSGSWQTCSANMPATAFGWDGTAAVDVQFRIPATQSSFASNPVEVTLPARPETPSQTIDTTTESITVAAGQEYSLNGGADWTQGTGAAVHVEPEAAIQIRVAAVENKSFRSGTLTRTAPARADAPNVGIDFVNETLGTATEMQYRVGESGSWENCSANMSVGSDGFGWNGTQAVAVYFRTAATQTNYASVPQDALTIPARPQTPTQEISNADESIVVYAGQEYRINGGENWTYSGAETTVPLEPGDKIEIRVAAAANQNFKSEILSHTAPARAQTPNVDIDYINETLSTTAEMQYRVGESGSWQTCSANMPATAFDWDGTQAVTVYFRTAATQNNYASDPQNALTIPARPETPTQEISNANENIVVEAGQEYRINGGMNWIQASDNTSVTLEPNDKIEIRVAAVANRKFKSETLTRTAPARAQTPDVSIDFANETLNTQAAMEYRVGENGTWQTCGANMSATAFDWDGTQAVTVYFRTAATQDNYASDPTDALTIPARLGAPEGVTGGTRVINGVNTTMEYSADGGSTWTAFTEETVASISAGAYFVRYRATDAAFASQPTAEITVRSPSGGTTTYRNIIKDAENGSVSASPTNPRRGQTVTITPVPDEGYEVEDITITDQNGNEVDVIDNGDGTYSFIQPGSRVTIEVTFRAIPEPEPARHPFLDVADAAWYADAVQYVWENGLMTGTSATTFSPDVTTSRAMIVTILWRLGGEPVVNYLMGFDDVTEGEWYTEAVRWAASEGIVLGVSDTAFDLDAPILREQLAAILYRYAAYKGYDVTDSADLSVFTDADEVSSYAVDALAWANAAGIVNGTSDTTLDPQSTAIRAQAAAMLQRFCENIVE